MKVSVVIPAYNEEKLLGSCIDSAQAAFAAQPGAPDHEIMVCDNNSADGTAALAAARAMRLEHLYLVNASSAQPRIARLSETIGGPPPPKQHP